MIFFYYPLYQYSSQSLWPALTITSASATFSCTFCDWWHICHNVWSHDCVGAWLPGVLFKDPLKSFKIPTFSWELLLASLNSAMWSTKLSMYNTNIGSSNLVTNCKTVPRLAVACFAENPKFPSSTFALPMLMLFHNFATKFGITNFNYQCWFLYMTFESQIYKMSALVQVMAWRWTSDKPLSEPMSWHLTQFVDTRLNQLQ